MVMVNPLAQDNHRSGGILTLTSLPVSGGFLKFPVTGLRKTASREAGS